MISETLKINQILLTSCLITATTSAQMINLDTLMDAASYIGEDSATGSFARINAGDGSLGSAGANTGDADGLYPFANAEETDPGSLLGSSVDLFPRETNFKVGNITYDTSLISGSGVETVAITGYDFSEFWASDPNRTSGVVGSPPSVVSDISDRAIGLWFFDGPGGITFGALDSSDTVTFTNGALTSIDFEIVTTFDVDAFGIPVSYSGTFSIVGNQLSYQINDSQPLGFFGTSNLVADLEGTVNPTVVPEPSAYSLFAGMLALSHIMLRRRKTKSEQE
ncbi:MAG: hypothetical protein AAGH40_07425 [Verrucomicrobiota bacterium]